MDWIARKKETARMKNEARAAAEKAFYESDKYKRTFAEAEAKKIKDGKTNSTGDWLKKVSKNAARNLNEESITIDKDKLFGKLKK